MCNNEEDTGTLPKKLMVAVFKLNEARKKKSEEVRCKPSVE